MTVTECEVVSVVLSVVTEPYREVVPYSTCESDGSFVVHVIVALLYVTPVVWMFVIDGAVVSAGTGSVVNDVFADDASALPASSVTAVETAMR
mgnify:CR=1 FL=1